MAKDRKDSDGELVTLLELCRKDPDWAASRILWMEERLYKVTRIGQMMSNVCFNLGQEAGPPLEIGARKSMKGLQVEWDSAIRAGRRSSTEGGAA